MGEVDEAMLEFREARDEYRSANREVTKLDAARKRVAEIGVEANNRMTAALDRLRAALLMEGLKRTWKCDCAHPEEDHVSGVGPGANPGTRPYPGCSHAGCQCNVSLHAGVSFQ